jgi:hypothetical protein
MRRGWREEGGERGESTIGGERERRKMKKRRGDDTENQ